MQKIRQTCPWMKVDCSFKLSTPCHDFCYFITLKSYFHQTPSYGRPLWMFPTLSRQSAKELVLQEPHHPLLENVFFHIIILIA